MERIFCISAGQLIVKKSDTVINRRNRYLNYGLLSLATILKNEGWHTLQIQGLFESPAQTIKKCQSYGLSSGSTLPLLISIPSFYAISWVNEFMSTDDYFYLKSFSYFSRNYQYVDYIEDLNCAKK